MLTFAQILQMLQTLRKGTPVQQRSEGRAQGASKKKEKGSFEMLKQQGEAKQGVTMVF